jgi:phospholipid transport system substrate-binding protein
MGKRMNTITIKLVLALLACAGAGVSPAPAADPNPAPPPSPRAVMDKAIQDAMTLLRDPKLSADQRREKVKQIAYDNLNFEVMARLCLGRSGRDLSDAQRTQFQQEFRQFVTNTYGATTDSYTDQDVKIVGDRQEPDGDWTVQTQIISTSDKKAIPVDYRLRKLDNQWKVIDFTVDGVSLVANFRSQFQDAISNGGIDHLIKLLHEKNAGNAK